MYKENFEKSEISQGIHSLSGYNLINYLIKTRKRGIITMEIGGMPYDI